MDHIDFSGSVFNMPVVGKVAPASKVSKETYVVMQREGAISDSQLDVHKPIAVSDSLEDANRYALGHVPRQVTKYGMVSGRSYLFEGKYRVRHFDSEDYEEFIVLYVVAVPKI